MIGQWREVFHDRLGYMGKSLVGEVKEWHNMVTRGGTLTVEDAYRGVDTIWRVLSRVALPHASAVQELKKRLLPDMQASLGFVGSDKPGGPDALSAGEMQPRLPREPLMITPVDAGTTNFEQTARIEQMASPRAVPQTEPEELKVHRPPKERRTARRPPLPNVNIDDLNTALVLARGMQDPQTADGYMACIADAALKKGDLSTAFVAAREVQDPFTTDDCLGRICRSALSKMDLSSALMASREISAPATAIICTRDIVDHALKRNDFNTALVAAREAQDDAVGDDCLERIALAALAGKDINTAMVAAQDIQDVASADACMGKIFAGLSR